ncbi:MAG TPA: hypothetical protein VGD03_12435, partial [Frankiaceae bacterium]
MHAQQRALPADRAQRQIVGTRESEYRAIGAVEHLVQDVVEPASSPVDGHVGLGHERAGQAAPGPATALHLRPALERWRPTVGGQPRGRPDAADDRQHAAAQDIAGPAAPGHQPAEQQRHPDQRPGVRLPLGLIAV